MLEPFICQHHHVCFQGGYSTFGFTINKSIVWVVYDTCQKTIHGRTRQHPLLISPFYIVFSCYNESFPEHCWGPQISKHPKIFNISRHPHFSWVVKDTRSILLFIASLHGQVQNVPLDLRNSIMGLFMAVPTVHGNKLPYGYLRWQTTNGWLVELVGFPVQFLILWTWGENSATLDLRTKSRQVGIINQPVNQNISPNRTKGYLKWGQVTRSENKFTMNKWVAFPFTSVDGFTILFRRWCVTNLTKSG